VSVNRKEKGGWEKLKQKKAKSLEEDASKCRNSQSFLAAVQLQAAAVMLMSAKAFYLRTRWTSNLTNHMLMVVMMRGRQLREFHRRRRYRLDLQCDDEKYLVYCCQNEHVTTKYANYK